jgi:hypothetical protein
VTNAAGDNEAGIIGDIQSIYGAYPGGSAFGPQSTLDVGVPLATMSCYPAPGHVHAVYATPAGDCHLLDVDVASVTVPTLAFGGPLHANCFNPRSALVNENGDVGGFAWETMEGGIESEVALGTMPTVVTDQGRSPRVAGDNLGNVWLAWIDTTAGADVLRVGRYAMTSTVVDEAASVEGVVPAGDEAFELVRLDTSVYLFVLSTAPAALDVFVLCSP